MVSQMLVSKPSRNVDLHSAFAAWTRGTWLLVTGDDGWIRHSQQLVDIYSENVTFLCSASILQIECDIV